MNFKVINHGKDIKKNESYSSGGPTGNSMGKAAKSKVSLGPGFSQIVSVFSILKHFILNKMKQLILINNYRIG